MWVMENDTVCSVYLQVLLYTKNGRLITQSSILAMNLPDGAVLETNKEKALQITWA